MRDDLAEWLVDIARGARAAVLLAHHVAAARLDRELDEVVAVPDVLDGDAELRALVDDPAELLEGARDELEHVDAEGIRSPRGLHAGPAHLLPGVVVRPVLHRTARILDARVGLERFPVAETGVDLKAAAEDVRLVHEPVEELERATRDAVDPLVRVFEDVLLDEGVERLRRGHEHLVVLEDLIALAAAVPVLGRVGRAVIGVHPRTHVLASATVLWGRAVEHAPLARARKRVEHVTLVRVADVRTPGHVVLESLARDRLAIAPVEVGVRHRAATLRTGRLSNAVHRLTVRRTPCLDTRPRRRSLDSRHSQISCHSISPSVPP